ncbi:MAG TPA: hypothetical protein VHF51_18145 [Solirubrobacteraceae bacterium]|nr:hypothetical protein [Solirubrobacteraceae bacterium]
MGTLRCAVVGTLLLAGALADAAAAATVTLTPGTLRPGRAATVSGTGFAPRATATVRFGSTARRVRTDGRGRLSAVVRVATSTPGGSRRLTVRAGRRRVVALARLAPGARPATAHAAADGYDWRFVDTSAVTRDAGSEACH